MTDERPNTPETEAALLGSIMRGGRETYERAREIVKSDMFYIRRHELVWDAFGRLYDAGMQIDTIVVGDELERMGSISELDDGVWSARGFLSQVRETGLPNNVETYARTVQSYHFKRFLLDTASKMAVWSANGRMPKEIMADVMAEFGKISLYSTDDEYTVSMQQAAAKAFDMTDGAAKGNSAVVQFGLLDLDKMLGGLFPNNFYIVAGRPGQGKSAFLLTVARNAAKRGKRVLIFSLETGGARVAQRLLAQEAEIDLHAIVTGKMLPDEWDRYVATVERISSWPITINDLSSISVHKIAQVVLKNPADLIIVDYIQLADSGEKNRERRELDVSAVSRGLKHLSQHVPVFAAAQLSRAVEARAEKRPVLSDLRESGSLEQDASVVMFIYHDERDKTAEIMVSKNRDGPTGSVPVAWRPQYTRFDSASFQYFKPNEKE